MKLKRVSNHIHKEIMDTLHPWPSDLPHHCPECSHAFDTRVNLSYDRYGYPKLIRKIAYWVPLPAFPFALMAGFTFRGNGAIMAIAAMTALPSILLNIIYAIHSIKRRVKCYHCDYEHFDKVSRYKKALV